MKLALIFVIFILMGAFFIISNNNLHVNHGEDFHKFMSSYYSWFGKIFDNVGSVTGYAVKMNWLPG